jgi:DNA-binding transcriptional ArsR family regulator
MEDQFKEMAKLIGDPTRATILWTLLDGKAFTATELAIAADTSAPNASMHLSKLVSAGLLRAEHQGRHRYYTFSSKEVAYAIEAIASLVPPAATRQKANETMPAIKYCRTCYDHLAGRMAVLIADSLVTKKIIMAKNKQFEITSKGDKWFAQLGIDTQELRQMKRSFARSCLDWSERRPHLAGAIGTALLDKMLAEDWLRRTRHSRAIVITGKGKKKIDDLFGIAV